MIQSTSEPSRGGYDVVIIGAGFYGCALAVHLAAKGSRVLVCESSEAIMERASAVNQARVHTGFHYPRSYATALRSLHNHQRFVEDYGPAVRRDFAMLYAIARQRSKVNARRFVGMFEAMGAPIERASPSQRALFDADLVEEVYTCAEYAFDYQTLRSILLQRLEGLPVEFVLGAPAQRVRPGPGGRLAVELASGTVVEAGEAFNITYSRLNDLLARSGIEPFALKHEFVEIALIEPPDFLAGLAVTVMDGAFFSTMPWPAAAAYSLTHVRYTPHFGWTDAIAPLEPYAMAERLPRSTRWRHMVADARRYMPAMESVRWRRSLFDVKTVPIKNEQDDGRPILLKEHPELPGFRSVLGSKIDNIYDLFEAIG